MGSAPALTRFATPSKLTLRKSSNTVRGLGRVMTYGTGSVASTTNAVLESTRVLIVFS